MLRVSGERRPRAQSPLETAEEGSPWRGDGRRAQGALFLTISGVFIGGSILGAVTVLALRREGWAIEVLPGQPVLCTRGEHFLSPHRLVDALRGGPDPGDWHRQAGTLGVAGVALSEGAPASSAA